MERLVVKNFGPIKDVNIEIPRLLVFIGDQASGKSTLGKLIYIFKHVSSLIPRSSALRGKNGSIDVEEFKRDISSKIKSYFHECFFYKNTEIAFYYTNEYFVNVSFCASGVVSDFRIEVTLSNKLEKSLNDLNQLTAKHYNDRRRIDQEKDNWKPTVEEINTWHKMNQIADTLAHNLGGRSIWEYIDDSRVSSNVPQIGTYPPDAPAVRRAMVAFIELALGYHNIQKARQRFIKIMSDAYIPPRKFAELFPTRIKRYEEEARRISSIIDAKADIYEILVKLVYRLLGGYVQIEENKGYGLALSDDKASRFIPYEFLSSGQKSGIPLIVCVSLIGSIMSDLPFDLPFNSMVIEEPETHLYPKKQFLMIKLIAAALAMNSSAKFVITTHSPYILSSIHALSAYGRADIEASAPLLKRYDDLVPLGMDKRELGIYLLENGCTHSLRDEQSGLFNTSKIDAVSNEITDVLDESIYAWDDEDE